MHHTRVFSDFHHTRVFTDSHHTMQRQCVIKSVIDKLHPMIIFKQNSFVYKPKAFFGCHTSHDHFIYKTICFLWAANFRGLTAGSTRLPTLFGLSPLECLNQSGLSPEGVSSPSCYYPTQVLPFYSTVRLYWTSSNGTELTHQSPSEVIDSNHALTPM